MSLKVLSAALIGLEAEIIEVEADSGGGDFGQIAIIGLPDASVSEARERVKSALRNCPYEFPRRKITINLAPANIKKHGPAHDLAIAISILALKNQLQADFKDCLFIGELSLSGELRPVSGVLAIALKMKKLKIKNLFIPTKNKEEAGLIDDINIFPINNLTELINHLCHKATIQMFKTQIDNHNYEDASQLDKTSNSADKRTISKNEPAEFDFAFIKGQEKAKRALEIAAAGGHNILLIGPPGSGKTLLAQTMLSIMPDLSKNEILEITNIYSIAGELKNSHALITKRPFRSPHHSASNTSLVGGGSWPRPGEISLAHRGLLFLDEFPEFSRSTLENLRQPLESGVITINRALSSLKFPCQFILIAAMNPCPCGYYGDKQVKCSCQQKQVLNYRHKVSGPMLDRIDLHVSLTRLNFEKLINKDLAENSLAIKKRVIRARKKQFNRLANYNNPLNGQMNSRTADKFCQLNQDSLLLLKEAIYKLNLSSRAYYKILKIARTIADLDSAENISIEHLAEALQYRSQLN